MASIRSNNRELNHSFTSKGVRFLRILLGLSCWLHMTTSLLGQRMNQPIHFDQLTIQNKLSHNTVRCLLQDRHGYVWIGTQNGLNKYDGYSFEVYRTDQQTGFRGKSITALLEDHSGTLWIGTAREGINILPPSREAFINLQLDSAFMSVKGFGISSIHEDRQGMIWITTVGAGVVRYDPVAQTSRTFTSENSGLSSNLTFDVAEDRNGNIWVAAAGLGINFLEASDTFSLKPVWSPQHENLAGYQKKLLVDGDFLWIGTEGTGLYRLGIDDGTITQYSNSTSGYSGLSSNGITDLYKVPGDKLFIATNGGGLNILDLQSDSIDRYNSISEDPTSLNSNALLCFMEDRSGNLWIGTYNGGINIYKPGKTRFGFLSPYSSQGQRAENWSVLALTQLQDGTILGGTDGQGLVQISQFEPSTSGLNLSSHPFNSRLPGTVVKAIHEDQRGRIWIGMFSEGLTCLDPSSQVFNTYRHEFWNSESLGGDNVWSISEDQSGKIWLGTLGGGLSTWDPQHQQFKTYRPDPTDPASITDANVMVVKVDQAGRVWVGTMDQGLDLWLGSDQGFQHFKHDPNDSLSLSDNEIRAIYEDQGGNIWIGTEGGSLNKWNEDGTFERIEGLHGLSGSSIMSITEDSHHNLWLSTYEGITCFNPTSQQVSSFGFRKERINNQFNQMAGLTAADGQVLFGGIKGLHSIYPSEVRENACCPQIILTKFTLFNKDITAGVQEDGRIFLRDPIETASEISLKYIDNSFSFSFASTDFDHPEQNRFFYKMEGFDREWTETEEGQHQAFYTNLEPGTYRFRIRLRGQEKAINLRITPPFWQQSWFRLLTIIMGLGLAFGGIYFVITRRETAFRRQALEARSEILRLQNEKLASEVEAANAKLVYSSAQMAHKNEILTQVKDQIQQSRKDQESTPRRLVRMLDQELQGENYWKEFNLYFNEVDKEFIQILSARHPGLTSNDLRLCALIRLGLTTKEIASLLNISVRGVEQGRYRLKKRLELNQDQPLLKYISEV